MANVKISDIATTVTDPAEIAFCEGEKSDGTPVNFDPSILASAATSWSYGTSERRFLMSVSASGSYSGNPNQSLAGSPQNSFFWGGSSGAQSLTFDFLSPKIVERLGVVQDNTTSQGTWTAEGSPDNSTWTSLATGLSWAPVNTNGLNIANFNLNNATAYRYYRLRKTAGSTSDSPFVNWLIFKCEPLG